MNRIVFFLILFLTVGFVCCEKQANSKNETPTCKIISPLDSTEIEKGTVITIAVEAEDKDGDIDEVRFYVDGIWAYSISSFPYNYEWDTSDKSVGNHTIKVIVKDDDNDTSEDEIIVKIYDPFSSVSQLYIDFPKAELSLFRQNISISHFQPRDSITREDTLIRFVAFSDNPTNYLNTVYCSIDSSLFSINVNKVFFYFKLNRSIHEGRYSVEGNTYIDGHYEIDRTMNIISLVINFKYEYEGDNFEPRSTYSAKWESELILENVPYKYNGEYIEIKLTPSIVINYLKYFNFLSDDSYINSISEQITKETLLELMGFESGKDLVFRIIP